MQLASQNIRVLAVARNLEKLKSLKKELLACSSLNHEVFSCDFSNDSEVETLTKHIAQSNSYQILICNSGGPKAGPLTEATSEDFLNGFTNHILTNQKLVQSTLPGMKESQWGRIINIISTSVKVPIANLGVSNTIRGAVAQWSKTLSLELGPQNITVNNVLPGYTATERLDELLAANAKKTNRDLSVVVKDWKSKVPMKRFGEAQEVASAVSFLCSENASYISGINLPVDGGRTGTL